MDPVFAGIYACIVAWYLTRGAADAAIDQARIEARLAAPLIREALQARGKRWLEDRLAAGEAGSPSTSLLWWAWAAASTYKAVRDGVTREPREAERARGIRGPTTPWQRIWDAAARGAKAGWEQARERRDGDDPGSADRERDTDAGERDTDAGERGRRRRARLGVCERCGSVVERRSLAWAVTPEGGRQRICAVCQAAADRPTDEPHDGTDTRPNGDPHDDVVDADIVDPRELKPATPELPPADPPVTVPPSGSPDPPPGPVPAGQPAVGPTTRPAIEGEPEPMAARSPGQIVPRGSTALIPSGSRSRGISGASYTHGEWTRAVQAIGRALQEMPAELEAMLRNLKTADAGRSQVTGVIRLHDDIVLFTGQLEHMLNEVDRREKPVLRAVEAAGGPDEIAGIPYLSDV